jgi:hypothetical protein
MCSLNHLAQYMQQSKATQTVEPMGPCVDRCECNYGVHTCRARSVCRPANITITIQDVIHRTVLYLKQGFGDWIQPPSPGANSSPSSNVYSLDDLLSGWSGFSSSLRMVLWTIGPEPKLYCSSYIAAVCGASSACTSNCGVVLEGCCNSACCRIATDC